MRRKRGDHQIRQTDRSPAFFRLDGNQLQFPIEPLQRVLDVNDPVLQIHFVPAKGQDFSLANTDA